MVFKMIIIMLIIICVYMHQLEDITQEMLHRGRTVIQNLRPTKYMYKVYKKPILKINITELLTKLDEQFENLL